MDGGNQPVVASNDSLQESSYGAIFGDYLVAVLVAIAIMRKSGLLRISSFFIFNRCCRPCIAEMVCNTEGEHISFDTVFAAELVSRAHHFAVERDA